MHCYRMLGSFEDAEDTVQETFLRAWRRRETFEGRSTFRAWLYRIATNACLDLLAKRRPEPATGGEVLWLQPYPDRLLDELPAGDADEPETVAVARETIELAYLVAVQHLAPRPRAVLILRDVLGWPAKDVAELLGDSVNSVNSALQRARAGMREHLPAERQDWTGGEEDAGTRELVRRYTDASVATDIDVLAAMLRDDVRCLDATHAGPVRRPRHGGERLGRERLRGHDGPARRPHLREPAARRRLLPLAEAGGRVPAADDRRPAHHRRGDHRDHHVPRRPVPAARAAGAPAGGRHGVVPVRTLALRGGARVAVVAAEWYDAFGVVTRGRVQLELRDGEPGPVLGRDAGFWLRGTGVRALRNPGRRTARVRIVTPRARTVTCQSTHPVRQLPNDGGTT